MQDTIRAHFMCRPEYNMQTRQIPHYDAAYVEQAARPPLQHVVLLQHAVPLQ